MAAQVDGEFTDVLDGRDGLLSQLYVTGRMLPRISSGDYEDLATPLHHNAVKVIRKLMVHH